MDANQNNGIGGVPSADFPAAYQKLKPAQQACPSCGHCPTCGHTPWPMYPWPGYYQPYQTPYNGPTWTARGGTLNGPVYSNSGPVYNGNL